MDVTIVQENVIRNKFIIVEVDIAGICIWIKFYSKSKSCWRETFKAAEIFNNVRTVVLIVARSILPIWIFGILQSDAKSNWERFLFSLNLRIFVPNFCRYVRSNVFTFQISKHFICFLNTYMYLIYIFVFNRLKTNVNDIQVFIDYRFIQQK